MQVYREWEVSFWDENANEQTARGIENVTALVDRSPNQFFKQHGAKYPGPSKYKLILRREDSSIEAETHQFSVVPEYPAHFETKHELRALLCQNQENYLDMLCFLKEMHNKGIKDLIVAVWYSLSSVFFSFEIEELLFIRDWDNEVISFEAAENKLKELVRRDELKILLEMWRAHESGIPPSKFLLETHRNRGVLFMIQLLRQEFEVKRGLNEIAQLIDQPQDLDRIFTNLKYNRMSTTIYHNQHCSKSCAMIDKLQEMKVDFQVVEYLQTPPTASKLKEIISMLGIRPEELVRRNEAVYLEKFSGKILTDEEWIEALAANPELIERPIVVHGNKAAIGRPVQNVIDLFEAG